MGLLHELHQVRSSVPGEELVRSGACDHGQLAWFELEGVSGEGGRLLGAFLVGCVCSTCSSLDGGELTFEGSSVMG